jgi:hypothetical protein
MKCLKVLKNLLIYHSYMKHRSPVSRINQLHSVYCNVGNISVQTVSNNSIMYWPRGVRHYTTNRKVAGSIPDGVIGIFQ